MSLERRKEAVELFRHAYQLQQDGRLEDAVILYQQSIESFATAEAHTFLGWAYRHQGRLTDAIAECERAIALDPDFGNPYNDIGSTLIDLDQPAAAIPWLKKALDSKRYESTHYAWFNLGRAYAALGHRTQARRCYEKALELQPECELAHEALRRLRG